MNAHVICASSIILSALATSANAATLWDESVNGQLSQNRLSPTNLALSLGVNTVIASSQSGNRDYVHFSLPAGMQLSQIIHVTWQSTDQLAFIGVQAGTTFTQPPTGTNVAALLGYAHFGPGASTIGEDILSAIGTGAGAMGFSGSLGGSDYTFWIQQTGPSLATYRLDFIVVPAPAAALGLVGLGAVCMRRRRM